MGEVYDSSCVVSHGAEAGPANAEQRFPRESNTLLGGLYLAGLSCLPGRRRIVYLRKGARVGEAADFP